MFLSPFCREKHIRRQIQASIEEEQVPQVIPKASQQETKPQVVRDAGSQATKTQSQTVRLIWVPQNKLKESKQVYQWRPKQTKTALPGKSLHKQDHSTYVDHNRITSKGAVQRWVPKKILQAQGWAAGFGSQEAVLGLWCR